MAAPRLDTVFASAVLGAALAASPAWAERSTVRVSIDYATPVSLSRPASTVVLGNPQIADVTFEDGKTLFIMGRSYGSTNLFVYDEMGTEVARFDLIVGGPSGRFVNVFRGTARVTLSCSPDCQQTVTPGDTADIFGAMSGQFSTKTGGGE